MFASLFFRVPRQIGCLQGHSGAVMAAAFSPTGRLLASGEGPEGVKFWDLKTRKEIAVPQQPNNEKGPVSSLCWLTRKHDKLEILCYGNTLGYLVFVQCRESQPPLPRWRRPKYSVEVLRSTRIAKGGEILCIAVDKTSYPARIGVSTRDHCIQVWKFDPEANDLSSVFSRILDKGTSIFPKALAFDNNFDKDLIAFGMVDGGMYVYCGKDGNRKARFQLRSQIGHATVDPKQRLCAIDNVGNGFDIYNLDSGTFEKALPTRRPTSTFPKSVVFAAQGRVTLGGSDHGIAYMFETASGHLMSTLLHAKGGSAETIAVYDEGDKDVVIATASSTALGASSIILWKWIPNLEADHVNAVRFWKLLSWVLDVFAKLAVLAAVLIFLSGNQNCTSNEESPMGTF